MRELYDELLMLDTATFEIEEVSDLQVSLGSADVVTSSSCCVDLCSSTSDSCCACSSCSTSGKASCLCTL